MTRCSRASASEIPAPVLVVGRRKTRPAEAFYHFLRLRKAQRRAPFSAARQRSPRMAGEFGLTSLMTCFAIFSHRLENRFRGRLGRRQQGFHQPARFFTIQPDDGMLFDQFGGRVPRLGDDERTDRLAAQGGGFLDQPLVRGGDAGKEPCVFAGLFRFTRCGCERHTELCAQDAHITSENHALRSPGSHFHQQAAGGSWLAFPSRCPWQSRKCYPRTSG